MGAVDVVEEAGLIVKKRKTMAAVQGVAAAVRREIAVGPRQLGFGIIAAEYPFWERSVEIGGELIWIWAESPEILDDSIRERLGEVVLTGDKVPLAQLIGERPVEVVLFDGPGPRPSHLIWNRTVVNLIAWLVGNSHCGPPANSDWIVARHLVTHSELGGSTSSKDRVFIATRRDMILSRGSFGLLDPMSVGPGNLARVVDGRVSGPPCPAAAAQVSGHLDALVDIRSRKESRVMPSFLSRTGFVRRTLTDKEWLRCLDCPATLLQGISADLLGQWACQIRTPFKTRTHIILSIEKYLVTPDSVRASRSSKRRSTEYEADGSILEPRLKRFKHSVEVSLDRAGIDCSSEEQRSEPPSLVLTHLQSGAELEILRLACIPADLLRKLRELSCAALVISETPASGFPQRTVGSDPNRNVKATKADDAEIPIYSWNLKVIAGLRDEFDLVFNDRAALALDSIRKFLLKYWKRKVARGFWNWWRHDKFSRRLEDLQPQYEALEPGLLAIHHAVDATWWDWDRGSAPFFWRFPIEWQIDMRDGLHPRFTGKPPNWKRSQRLTRNPVVLQQEREKIAKVRSRGYIGPSPGIVSLLYFFSVPKGTDDIRMVYDGTKSGLNLVLFAPWFFLPTVDSLSRSMGNNYWSADNDYGEMFLNFWLHPKLRPFCGVDLTTTFPEEVDSGRTTLWEAWTRNAMGLRPSPYASCQAGTRLKRLMLGDRHDPANVFRWSRVSLNLPGSTSYDASQPWVFKERRDGSIAADIHKYVDDVRETAPTRGDVELASSKVAKTAAYFGCQDAARKKREASKTPGSWAGANVEATPRGVFKTVSQERWDRTKNLVEAIEKWSHLEYMPRKALERARGFLVYVALTFPILSPYLKGVHLSLESWRSNRDAEGWKTSPVVDEDGWNLSSIPDSVLSDKLGTETWDDSIAPDQVKPVPRLATDVRALRTFTQPPLPPRLQIRPRCGAAILFIYADASGVGFGSSVWLQGSDHIQVEEGLWSLLFSEKSSNFREMCNITLRLESLVREGTIPDGTEVFIFTDNQVTERAFYRGTASTPELFELVLRMRTLEMTNNLFLRIVWVAGTRMIEQGTDGFSRGDLENGVATGRPMLAFVPLNLHPFDRSAELELWLRSTLADSDVWVTLDPTGWFDAGHREGLFIWDVPPAAAQIALEQLCEAKLARPYASHIFVCPALMTPMWRKRLGKLADFVFGIPPTVNFWNAEQHEPVLIGIVCPLLSSRPWQLKLCPDAQRLIEDVMHGVWRGSAESQRDSLRQLWLRTGELKSLASDLDDSVVAPGEFDETEDKNRFQEARNGDHFLTPFQCDVCHFFNVRGRPPMDAECDRLFLKTIRRALLDSMWSRERTTVAKNLNELRLFLSNAKLLGNDHPLPPRGPYPMVDTDGMEVACNLLLRSLRPGRNSQTVQFETMRKGRSVYSNYVHASCGGLGRITIARGDRGGSVETSSPTNSVWFGRFLSGCHRRMGDLWIPDRALTIDEVLAALSILEDDWHSHSSHPKLLLDIALTGALIVAGGGAGLRGEECPQIDLGPLRKHWPEGEFHPRAPHVPLVLVGRFKQTEGLKLYFQPLAIKSASGIEYKLWIQRAIGVWQMLGVTSGPLFRTMSTKSHSIRRATVADLDILLHDILKRVQTRMPGVIPATVNVENEYSARRSLRRFFTTQAQNVGVPKEVIETNNRWRKHMHSRGRLPTMQMIERYSDAKASVEILIKPSSLL